MATKTTVQLLDDIDGSPAEESLVFSVDGVTYEMDLSTENATTFRSDMEKWTDVARRLRRGEAPSGRSSRATSNSTTPTGIRRATSDDRPAIQAFAAEHGLKVPADRGRISADVLMAWEDAGRPGSPGVA